MAHEQSDSHSIRILPRVTLGGLPGGEHGVELWEEPTRLVAHLHMGSWKSVSFKRKARLLMDEGNAMAMLQAPSKMELQQRLYPVSIIAEPSFTVMTYLKGQNRVQVRSRVLNTLFGVHTAALTVYDKYHAASVLF